MKIVYQLDKQTLLIKVLGVPSQIEKTVYIADNGSAYVRDSPDFFFDIHKSLNDNDIKIMKEVVHNGQDIWYLGEEFTITIS